mmetsp:Transcript_62464/g.111011  ORF Transcript_62464/g.111011 Transcript_62464/m.111011 type:complete len:293 (-) Transcript_62464:34-912(-)
MAHPNCMDQLQSLTGELFWAVLLFLGDKALCTSAASSYLLPFCERARLHFFLVQLGLADAKNSGPSRRRLSDGGHVLRRLCPPQCSRRAAAAKHAKPVQLSIARLVRVAKEGDRPLIILSILPWVEHGDLSTRTVAVRALLAMGKKGDDVVMRAVLGRLKDPVLGGSAMEAAIEGLKILADRGDPEIVNHVYALLDDGTFEGRYAALQALPSVVPKGDEVAIEKVMARLDDKEYEVREVAIRTLALVATEGHLQALTQIVRGLRDESIYVRRAAMEIISSEVCVAPAPVDFA